MNKDDIIKQALGQPPMQLQQTVVLTLCDGEAVISKQDSAPGVIEIRVYGHSQKSLVHVEVTE